MPVVRSCCAIIAALCISGCASQSVPVKPGEPRVLSLPPAGARVQPPGGGDAAAGRGLPSGSITLRDALAAALMCSPGLAASGWEIRAAEARTLQASLRPNPEIEAEVEEFGGRGERAGFGAAESTLRLSQLLELGGKRGRRQRVAAASAALAGWDYEARRLDVLTDVAKAFVDVLAAQQQIELAGEALELAGEMQRAAVERVKAGKVSPVEETRANVAAAAGRIELEQARSGLEAARTRLATLCGAAEPAFDRAEGSLYATAALPQDALVFAQISANPDVARWAAEIEQRRAALNLERAKRTPDVTVSAGLWRTHEANESAFVAGVSIPLPLFDRNQGAVREAMSNLAKAGEERRAAELKAVRELADAWEALVSAHTEAAILSNEVLPGAQSAFDAAREGYRQGKFDFIDAIDARRTLIESKSRHIRALAQYHKAVSDIERLTGQPMDFARSNEQ